MGTWHALHGEAERVSELANAARGRMQDSSPDSVAAYGLLSDVLDAWATYARGDIDEAIVRFAALTPVTPPDGLQWTLWEPLAAERLALAHLRMEAGDYEGVLQAAAALDQSQSIVYVAFVDESLRLRVQAAEALGRAEQADLYRGRLDRLRPDLRLIEAPPLEGRTATGTRDRDSGPRPSCPEV